MTHTVRDRGSSIIGLLASSLISKELSGRQRSSHKESKSYNVHVLEESQSNK